ncbi:MAG TPA: MCP four helix bundle domain-containing protein [Bryobacteraceae bacterium]|nr:MCP four helix bundle domain-containing protein [Bryobacteraceae bacterium]
MVAARRMKSRVSDRLPVSSRLTLTVGFGGLLLIMALAGIDAMRVLQQVRREDDRIRRQFLFRNHVLNDIRSQLYLSGTYVRDYLLEPDPARASLFLKNLQEVRGAMGNALASYGKQLEPREQQHYRALTTELSRYWQTMDPVLTWDAAKRRSQGYIFLRDSVFPRREAMLEIAGRIADTNEQQLNAGNDRVVDLLLKFQNRLAVTLFATLALGLGMAGFSIWKILRLEAHTQARYEEVAEARNQLTNLSAKLLQAQETERRALSRELHDEVGQALSAVLVELRNLSTGLTARSETQSRTQIDVIRGLVESTVRVVRNMSLLLRPSMLDDLGLVPALRWQAREVSKRTGMDVSVTTDLPSDDLPDECNTCIFRVVQEALHNCSRHSHASTVRIRVQQRFGLLTLSVQDDGVGFDVKQSKGMGLLGIEERVTRLGGAVEVHSEPGHGAILSVELPFHIAERGTQPSEADSHSVSG